MTALICGSVAYDTVMVFDGHFKDHILADRIHMLNVSFLVPALRRNFGGCAGNIGYNLKMIGGEGRVMATVGIDFAPYRAWMKDCGVSTEFVREMADEYTAQAYITTDADNNQITAFHPGAMQQAHHIDLPARGDLRIAIIAPDGREAMSKRAQQLANAAIPFIFDPGQQLPLFDGTELRHFVERAAWVAVNDYEGRMLCDRTGLTLASMSRLDLNGVIVTLGHEGCDLWIDGQCERIPGVAAEQVVDPTGCGDAFRGALLYGLERGWPLRRCVELGNRVGALKIACRGGQNHVIDRAAMGL
jgi:adenosine kinase